MSARPRAAAEGVQHPRPGMHSSTGLGRWQGEGERCMLRSCRLQPDLGAPAHAHSCGVQGPRGSAAACSGAKFRGLIRSAGHAMGTVSGFGLVVKNLCETYLLVSVPRLAGFSLIT